jgi:hypothetical protein
MPHTFSSTDAAFTGATCAFSALPSQHAAQQQSAVPQHDPSASQAHETHPHDPPQQQDAPPCAARGEAVDIAPNPARSPSEASAANEAILATMRNSPAVRTGTAL